MKTRILLVGLLHFTLFAFTQSNSLEKRNLRFPIWITHSNNADIAGLSLAVFPKEVFRNDTTLTRTFGVRVEASVLAVFSPLMPKSPVSQSLDSYQLKQNTARNEIVYGVNLSSGTFGMTKVTGISAALFLQYLYNMDGISFAVLGNLFEKHNGIALSPMGNEAFKASGIHVGLGNEARIFNGLQIGAINTITMDGVGLQIGIWNTSKNFKGIQLGLWNKNSERSLPIINWNFK